MNEECQANFRQIMSLTGHVAFNKSGLTNLANRDRAVSTKNGKTPYGVHVCKWIAHSHV